MATHNQINNADLEKVNMLKTTLNNIKHDWDIEKLNTIPDKSKLKQYEINWEELSLELLMMEMKLQPPKRM